MKGLIVKDLLVMRRYARTSALVAAVFAAMGLISPNNTSFTGMICMFSTMMVINAFSYDDYAKWDRYALATPVSRKTMVGARYLLGAGLTLAGILIALLIFALSGIIHGAGADSDSVAVVVIIASGMVIAVSVGLPLLYKFGVERARMLLLVAFLVPSALIAAPLLLFGEGSLTFFKFVMPFVAVLVYVLSYFVAVRIVEGKDY